MYTGWIEQARIILKNNNQILNMIVAQNAHGAIGIEDQLPWHIPEDLAFFKKETMQAQLIMGRKTYQSIGRPLPGRRMLVLSRKVSTLELHPGVEIFNTPLDAIQALDPARTVFIAGGSQIYTLFEPLVQRACISLIDRVVPRATEYYHALEFVQKSNFEQIECRPLGTETTLYIFRRPGLA